MTVVYNDQPTGRRRSLPNEPVKIWADVPTTISVEGVSYLVGPGDSHYAAVVTGVDGSFVVTSGYIKQDGSDTPMCMLRRCGCGRDSWIRTSAS